MRRLTFLFVFLAGGAPALGAETLQSVTLPASAVQHALIYLRTGGTRAEGDALADQLLAAAQADVAKQQSERPSDTPSPSGK